MPRRLQTKWRDECICPVCKSEITEIEVMEDVRESPDCRDQVFPAMEDVRECPDCGAPISIRVRDRREYLVLA